MSCLLAVYVPLCNIFLALLCPRTYMLFLYHLPVRRRISHKLAVITYKTNSSNTPAYLSDIIHEYHPTRTL